MKTKIKIADLQKKLTFPAFRKEFLRLTTDMKSDKIQGGTSPEDAIPIYIKANHSFVCQTEHPLVILAGKSPAWKKAAKDAFKEDKKMMLEGSCFVDSNKNLNIIVEKGNLKLTELKKLIKALVKKAGLKTVVYSDGKGTVTEGEVETSEATTQETPGEAATEDTVTQTGDTSSDTATEEAPTGEESSTSTDDAANPADQRRERRREKQKEKGRKAIDTMTMQLEKLMEKLKIQ